MNFKGLLAAAALACSAVGPAHAAPVTLSVSGNICVLICPSPFSTPDTYFVASFYGLDDEVVGLQSATSFDLNTGVGSISNVTLDRTYPDDPFFRNITNEFEISPGYLSVDFGISGLIYFGSSSSGYLTGFGVSTSGSFGNMPGTAYFGVEKLDRRGVLENVSWFGTGRVSNSYLSGVAPVVPLPAGGLLLLTGLVGLAAAHRLKKRVV